MLNENTVMCHLILATLTATTAVHFLTRTFRNVFYVRVGKRYVRLWRSQRSLRRLAVRRKTLATAAAGARATPTAAAGAVGMPRHANRTQS